MGSPLYRGSGTHGESAGLQRPLRIADDRRRVHAHDPDGAGGRRRGRFDFRCWRDESRAVGTARESGRGEVRGVALGCLLAIGIIDAAQTPAPRAQHPRGYVAYRSTSALAIDGRLTEPAWLSADWTEPFVDIEGDVRPKPAYLTRVKMAWDDSNFYIGALLAEPHLWATLKEHDSVIFRDNDFEVFIDPNGDNHEYYELEINALNTTWDLLLPKPYKDDGKAVNGWEIAGMKTAVNLDGTLKDPRDVDRGWTVEIALPWKALGELARRPSPPKDGDQWRVNFSRVQWQLNTGSNRYEKVPKRSEDNWVWSPQCVIDMHRPERWGYVQFSTAAAGSVQFRRGRELHVPPPFR